MISGILEKKETTNGVKYLIKWENYELPTWEPKANIPSFLVNYYERTCKNTIPPARVSHSKVVGGSKFHLLTWDSPDGETYWEEEQAFQFENSEECEEYSCNTRKVLKYNKKNLGHCCE